MIRMLQSCFEEVLSLIADALEARQLETARRVEAKEELANQLADRIPCVFVVFALLALLLLNKHRYYVDSGMGAAWRRAIPGPAFSGEPESLRRMAQHGSACSKCSKCVHVRFQARARAWAMA